jgi:UDP-glucose 4-epimerase
VPRALVIGCGFLGGHILRGLATRGIEASALSRSFSSAVVGTGSELLEGEAEDRVLLRGALRGVNEVIYCIGGLPPAAAQKNPGRDARLLLEPLRAVIAALEDHPEAGITYLSSGGAIYGNPASLPVSETHPVKPIGAYARVRLAGEHLLETAHKRCGLRTRILRASNVYGEYQPLERGLGAVGVFIDQVAHGRRIELFGDGENVRDFFYAGDLASAVAQLIERRTGSVLLNVGSGVGSTINDLIAIVERELGRRAFVEHKDARPFDVRRVVLDLTRLRRFVDWEPLPLEDGVALLADAMSRREAELFREPVAVAL